MWAFLARIRAANGLALLVALEGYAAILLWSNQQPRDALGRWLERMDGSDAWLAPVAYPLLALILVLFGVVHVGGLRGADLGWRRTAAMQAAVATVLFWLFSQVALRFLGARDDGRLGGLDWTTLPSSYLVTSFLVHVLGSALAEETFFRGILLPQVYLRCARVVPRALALALAIVVSNALFLLSHVPVLWSQPTLDPGLAGQLLWIGGFGAILTVVFLVSRNVFLCVGLHALWNSRPAVFAVRWEDQEAIWYGLTAVLVVGWGVVEPLRRSSLREQLLR
jgi:membrane protease YdiL (CAAX protease family)